jgi:hypothetical protein
LEGSRDGILDFLDAISRILMASMSWLMILALMVRIFKKREDEKEERREREGELV